jgi:hypothetical protein
VAEPKWTPGPWWPEIFNNELGLAFVVNRHDAEEDDIICSLSNHADARLIAAAPELYDELENARAIIAGEAPQYGEAIARIDASLAKARGEP